MFSASKTTLSKFQKKKTSMPHIKQIVAIRRKPGLTRQEFFDYHFQVHGKLSQAPSPDITPSYVD
jgi:DNA-binding transcriptional regulator YiaG